MVEPVKTRGYRSPLRRQQARRTRRAILEAALRLFAAEGYAATTVASIAAEAGVAVDTIYTSVGTKPLLFRLLLETALSGTDEPVPAEERDYVQRVSAASTALDKITIYAAAVRTIAERMAPLLLVLRDAASQAPELGAIREEIAERRSRNMRLFAQDLAATGDLRPDLDIDEVADVVWSTSSAEFYALLVHRRGWPPERFERWLAEVWCRLFLTNPTADARQAMTL